MTVPSIAAISAEHRISGRDDRVVDNNGVGMRAQCRHVATVVTISGDVGPANIDVVGNFATRFARVGNALVLDLSGVKSFAAQAVSVLTAVDDACALAEVPWVLVPSHAVSRVLQVTGCDTTELTVSAVPAALRQIADLSRARRRLALVTPTAPRHAG